MRAMKDSGVEWLGAIPLDWDRVSLLRVLRQSITDGPHETPNYVEEGVPFVSVDSINETENVDLSNVKKYISEADYENYNRKTNLTDGDILFTKSATIGKTAIVDTKEKYMVWSPLAVIKPNHALVDKKYLYYQFNSDKYIEHVSLLGTSNTQVNVGMRTLEKSMIVLPCSLDEQQKIASYLDQKVALIDNIIEKTKQSIEEYKKYKQSLITETVTKGLYPNVKMKDSGIEWFGEIPEHWDVKAQKYIMSKSKEICERYDGENILSLTRGGVIIRDLENPTGKMPTTFDGYQIVYSGNLLLCLFDIDVTPRCVGLIKDFGLTSPAYSQFIVKEDCHVNYYNLLLEMIDDIKAFLHLSKNLRSSLTETDFGAIKTIVPPFDEQVEIALFVEEKKIEIDKFLKKKEKFISELEAYKKSLIYEVVTGKIEIQ